MQYFTIQAKSHWEAVEKMKVQYGPGARVLTRKNVKIGGFLGVFRKEGVEVTGYISQEISKKKMIKIDNEKQKILQSVKKDQTMDVILKELQDIKDNLTSKGDSSPEMHDSIKRIKEILINNDFTYEYIDKIINRLRNDFSLEDLNKFVMVQRAVLNWIGDDINIFPTNARQNIKSKIIIIVGPTGVGKTTTIAKLAAIYGLGTKNMRPIKVRMVTIDNYKIAAKKQIETYADIMQIPVSFIECREDLEKIITLYQDTDIILIDTIGKSPQDYEKLSEMQNILSVCGSLSEVHLAISSTTKTSDVENILHQFEPYKYKAVILTKMDETQRIGNIISVLSKCNKKISYLTDGQMVPQDIEYASVPRFLMNLDGFRIDREWIEEKYNSKNIDNNKRME